MALICPNKNLKEWKDLVTSVGENRAMIMWYESQGKVGYNLKATSLIMNNLTKVNNWFKQIKNTDVFWNKLQKDLGIPKEQINLLKESKGNTIEEKLADFVANYSYTVEINTATEQQGKERWQISYDPEYGGAEKPFVVIDNIEGLHENFKTEQEAENFVKSKGNNTKYYSNLTVPGGTNYTENEIATPVITPSIKGHAQFSTDNGIGWFRSDEQVTGGQVYQQEEDDYGPAILQTYDGTPTKTRRILEVQSDLFQKGRDKKNLLSGDIVSFEEKEFDYNYYGKTFKLRSKNINGTLKIDWKSRENEPWFSLTKQDNPFNGEKEFEKFKDTIEKELTIKRVDSKNQFLQLLNKDNNWVTFFVKSIIQDSAKKGYEKVLFPKGDTAAKVEGHATLEEFKKQKEDRIEILERENRGRYIVISDNNKRDVFTTEQRAKEVVDFYNKEIDEDDPFAVKSYYEYRPLQKEILEANINEINQLKQELERIEGPEGFAALKPIYNFYENTVTNILKKQGYKPTIITDEYGNTWNEIEINDKDLDTISFKKADKLSQILGKYNINNTGYGKVYNRFELKKALENAGFIGYDVRNTEKGTQYVVDNRGKIVKPAFKKASEQETQVSKKVLTKIANTLKDKLGVDYDIISSEKAKTLVNDPTYNGKDPFYHTNGKVYIVEGEFTLETPIHEFSHPFVRAIAKKNPKLFEKIVGDILSTPEGEALETLVKQLYPEKIDSKTGNLRPSGYEELVVRGLTEVAKDNVDPKTGKPFIAAIKRLLLQFKQLFREIFGKDVKVADLNENTTLQELADMLTIGTGKINLTSSFTTTSNVKVDISKGKEFIEEEEISFNRKDKKEQVESAFEKQTVFFKRRLAILERRLKNLKPNDPKIEDLTNEINQVKTKLDTAVESQNRDDFKSLGEDMLNKAEQFIVLLEEDRKAVSKDNLLFTLNTLQAFEDFTGLRDRVSQLFTRIYPFLSAHTLEVINDNKTENFEITEEMLDAQNTDIGNFTKWVGALSDLSNYIGRTIGSLIKAAQNRASTTNKQLVTSVQKEVDKLEKWAKSNGKTLQEAYDMIIVETKNNDIQLVNKWANGERNPKYDALFKPNNKPLLEFYNFYRETLNKAQENLPYKVNKYFIPNIAKSDIRSKFKSLIKTENVLFDEFRSSEDLYADIVPDKYRNKIDINKKSRDLGASILEFAAYSNMHNELSEVLPEVRLLQEQLKYKQLPNGEIKEREFIKSTDPKTRIKAEDTNIYKMVNTVIDMQLKGKMSESVFGNSKRGEIKDKDGNVIGYKQVSIDSIFDLGLKYNSLLRIGLSPITAISNVLFGDVSNVIEAIGGRFFGLKELNAASFIFFNQINYNPKTEKKSELYHWLEKLNPLQELDDYNITDKVRLDKMSTEKAQEYMYSMQKKGELFLQSRTMLAILIKEGYMNKKGETTEKGKNITEKESQQLSDKIQRLNQMIHGRYSQREAATLQQSVIYRMMIQFRKWIPSAIEARIGKNQYDNRLGVEIEGRYRTLARLVGTKEVLNNLIKMSKGELSELEMYNMKKNLIELTLLTASILSYMALFGGDDDKDKERRKNPLIKTLLTLTNRVSGDLMFFYSPSQINNLALNAAPLAKTTNDLIKTINYLPAALYLGDWKLKRGNLKGSNKFYAQLNKSLIGLKPIQEVVKLVNDNPLNEFN